MILPVLLEALMGKTISSNGRWSGEDIDVVDYS